MTTDDECTHHATFTACYQLVQSVLKIGSVLAERVGQEEVGGCHLEGDSAWRLLQLAVKKALVSTGLAISLLFHTNGHRNRSSVGAPFFGLETVFSRNKRSLVREP